MLREIEKIIYRLKRQYGVELTLRTPTDNTPDYATGNINRPFTEYIIKRAVILPKALARIFLSTGGTFKYGGYFDETNTYILIDNKDLVDGYIPTGKDNCVMNDRVYEIEKVRTPQNNKAHVLVVKELSRTDSV